MRAMQYRSFGGPDQIVAVEVPVPRPAAGQILVKLAATSVNPVDWKLRHRQSLFYRPVSFPSIPGADLSGVVAEVGDGVSHFKSGDRIYAMASVNRGATCAEYALVDARVAMRAPSKIPLADTAAIPLAGLTALQSLRNLGGLAPSQRVLIVGAAGGVGHFAIQIARSFGAHVTAVCSSRHVELVRKLGADVVIDYTQRRGFQGVKAYDLIFDLIASAPLNEFFDVMTPTAVYVSALPSVSRVGAAMWLPLRSQRRVRLSRVQAQAGDLELLRAMCDAGKLRPFIDKRFPLSELAAAHAYSQQGRTSGKIVIDIGAVM